jgi:hypothetical protein
MKNRQCPACKETKPFRSDSKTCGCIGNRNLENVRMALKFPRSRSVTKNEFISELKSAAKAELDDLKRQFKSGTGAPKVKVRRSVSGKMLELNLTDIHFGKLSWGTETGYANYDAKIAKALWYRALNILLVRSANYKYDEIWFVVGNDMLNSDDVLSRTTSGTQVESDVRHEKTYKMVREILVDTVELLRNYANKIKIVVMPGNHDFNSAWHLGDSLECYFHKYKDVEIDNSPRVRKYHTYGNTLIGYTHGDKGKRSDLPMLMATEASEQFGKSKFREFHTGHLHAEITHEKNGVVVRILSALCPPDAWHSENGYVGNRRSSQAFQWDEKEGLIGTVIYTDTDDKIQ